MVPLKLTKKSLDVQKYICKADSEPSSIHYAAKKKKFFLNYQYSWSISRLLPEIYPPLPPP